MILWAEGSAKLGHTPGVDSCGASLREMAQICADVGMVNAINLDGGGSSTFIVKKEEELTMLNRPADLMRPDEPLIREIFNSILVVKK